MFSIEDVYKQAVKDKGAIHRELREGISIINKGIKLNNFPSQIEMLNLSKGGDYPQELTAKEYKYFFKNGWEKGCLLMIRNNCKRKLEMIEARIKEEINSRKNDKFIHNLKTKRENVLIKYAENNKKLIKLQSNGKKEKHL